MNLLYFNPVGAIGGAEMCLLDLLRAIRRDRPTWRPSVVLGDDGPMESAVGRLGVRCEVEPMPRGLAGLGDSGGVGPGLLARMARSAGSTASYLGRLRRRFRLEGPDLVQTNGMKAHLLGAWAAPGGVPVAWHLHDYPGERPAMARLLRASARRASAVVAVSRSVAEDARRVLGRPGLVRAIHNAVDLDDFAPGPGDGPGLDRLAGWPEAPPGTVRVGLVATFARWKGHATFFDAVARIPEGRPARFYVVGGPIYRSGGSQWSLDELMAEADRRGVLGRVGFVGPVDDPAAAFRSIDVAVHASTRPEPFGRAIVEAMACGRAVVAIRDGGAAETFEDGASALGCPPGDPDALARAVDRLLLDPGLRRDLGRAARASALARFDAARLLDSWGPLYQELLGPGGGRPGRIPFPARVPPGRAADTEVTEAHGR